MDLLFGFADLAGLVVCRSADDNGEQSAMQVAPARIGQKCFGQEDDDDSERAR